jgi:hypothetical protein
MIIVLFVFAPFKIEISFIIFEKSKLVKMDIIFLMIKKFIYLNFDIFFKKTSKDMGCDCHS